MAVDVGVVLVVGVDVGVVEVVSDVVGDEVTVVVVAVVVAVLVGVVTWQSSNPPATSADNIALTTVAVAAHALPPTTNAVPKQLISSAPAPGPLNCVVSSQNITSHGQVPLAYGPWAKGF